MFAAALVVFIIHFTFQPVSARFERAASVLTQPAPHYYAPATAAPYYAPATTAPYDSRVTSASRPFSDTVATYYLDINNREYSAAYALLSPGFQSTQPYAKWVDGYSDTLSADPRIIPGSDPTALSLVVTARERTADGTGTQVTVYNGAVRGIPSSSGSWLIDSGYLRMVRRVRE
jgi:hypothetical protein